MVIFKGYEVGFTPRIDRNDKLFCSCDSLIIMKIINGNLFKNLPHLFIRLKIIENVFATWQSLIYMVCVSVYWLEFDKTTGIFIPYRWKPEYAPGTRTDRTLNGKYLLPLIYT